MLLQPIYQLRKLVALSGPWNRRLFNRTRMLSRLLYHLYYISSRPDGTCVSVADRDEVWSLWQTPIGESQKTPLGIQSKALPSSADKHSPFGRQLLACYWTLEETEHLTMGYQVSTQPKLPIMDPPSHKVGHVQHQSIRT